MAITVLRMVLSTVSALNGLTMKPFTPIAWAAWMVAASNSLETMKISVLGQLALISRTARGSLSICSRVMQAIWGWCLSSRAMPLAQVWVCPTTS